MSVCVLTDPGLGQALPVFSFTPRGGVIGTHTSPTHHTHTEVSVGRPHTEWRWLGCQRAVQALMKGKVVEVWWRFQD